MPLYSLKQWFWWMSNDDYAWQNGAVYEAKNVDLSNSKWVKLSRWRFTHSLTPLFTQSQWAPVWLLEYGSFTNRLIASRNWILKNFQWIEYNISSKTSNIFNIWAINNSNIDYWFIVWSQWKIWRWNLNSALDLWIWSWWVNIVDSWISLPLDTNWWNAFFRDKTYYLLKWPKLYITWWNGSNHNVYSIELSVPSVWSCDETFLALDRWFDIRYMSNIGDQIVIYATNGNMWKQYFWDWISATFDRHIDWYDRPILWWASINNIDYVITWTSRKRELYQVQGYQANKLFETDVYVNNTEAEKFFFDPESGGSNTIETIWDTLLLPWQWYFYKFWNNKIWLPKNITREKVFWYINLISYNDTFSDNLTICTQSSSYNWTFQYFIVNWNIRQPNDSWSSFSQNIFWQIEWLKFDAGAYSIKKGWVKCKVWYSLPTRFNSTTIIDNWINVYARVDNQYEYANFYTYEYSNGSYTTKPSIWDVYSLDWKQFTIYDITDRNNKLSNWSLQEVKNFWLILHTRCSDKRYSLAKRWQFTWVLTKVSWNGDSLIKYYDANEWYELINKIRAINSEELWKKDKTFMFSKEFYEIQFKYDLFTNDEQNTPELREFHLQYNFIQNELS